MWRRNITEIDAICATIHPCFIIQDACDENSWDRVGDQKMYPISNSCGQLGQSYQVRKGGCMFMYEIA
jgi:hypothetical protein